MDNEKTIEEGIDLESIREQYEEKGFFTRLGILFSGIGRPRNTREYKEARIELQRLAAPLIALLSVSMFVVVLIVVTAIQSTPKTDVEITIAQIEDDPTPIVENRPEKKRGVSPHGCLSHAVSRRLTTSCVGWCPKATTRSAHRARRLQRIWRSTGRMRRMLHLRASVPRCS